VLPVEAVADLVFDEPVGATGTRHVEAASGLAIVDEVVYVVTDDELYLAAFPDMGRGPGSVIPLLAGSLPRDDDRRSDEKPDLESLTPLAPFGRNARGGLIALGSGSAPPRRRAVFAAFGEEPATAAGRELDATDLFDRLERDIPGLNLEGTAVSGGSFRVFQRGNLGGGNAHIDLDLEGLLEQIDEGVLRGDLVTGVRGHDLGTLRGVPLCFADADTLDDGRIVFSASAEANDGAGDGPTAGSALGIMDPSGEILRLEPFDLEIKAEGLAARRVDDGIEAFMVTDEDEPDVPSRLLRVLLPDA
jgi:hypothetical protein